LTEASAKARRLPSTASLCRPAEVRAYLTAADLASLGGQQTSQHP
jgi:hypothetical protein